MTPLQIALLAIEVALTAGDVVAAYDRLANGISAKAEAEGRAVTDEEMALIKSLRELSAKRRRGEV